MSRPDTAYLFRERDLYKTGEGKAGHFSLSVTDGYTHAIPSDEVIEDVLDFRLKRR